ncbi:hypothetical protein ACFLQ2_02655 [archaeon]
MRRDELFAKKQDVIPKISPPAGPEKKTYDKLEKMAGTFVNKMYRAAKKKRKKRRAKQFKKDMKESEDLGRVMPDNFDWIEFDGKK